MRSLENFLINKGKRKMRDWIVETKAVELTFRGDPHSFFNINQPGDLEAAQALYQTNFAHLQAEKPLQQDDAQ